MSYPTEYMAADDLYEAKDFAATLLTADVDEIPTSIEVSSTRLFPEKGIITITSINEPARGSIEENWACSFSYSSKTETSFVGLTITKGNFVPKKRGDKVSLNVISDHHNTIAEEILRIEKCLGPRMSTGPETISYRTDSLIEKVKIPRAFFIADIQKGFSPLTVHFTDLSSRGPDRWVWDFGDGETSFTKNPTHVFTEPGVYSVKLSVFNDYGSDEFRAVNLITSLDIPPDEPSLEINPNKILLGETASVFCVARDSQPNNRLTIWDWKIPEETSKISSSLGISSTGMPKNFFRTQSPAIEIGMSKGGFFDISVIGRTSLGGSIGVIGRDILEVVENSNLWDLRYDNGDLKINEMGLLSRSFKQKSVSTLQSSPGILEGYDRYLLKSNNQFCSIFLNRDQTASVKFHEYDGFLDNWKALLGANRQWGESFLSFEYNNNIYLLFGKEIDGSISKKMARFNLISRTGWVEEEVVGGEIFDGNSEVYTSANWLGTHSSVYILSRSGISVFDSFSQLSPETKTIISVTSPSDAPGSGSGSSGGVDLRTKSGQLVSLRDGIYLFGPVGSISKYNPSTDVWMIDQNSKNIFNNNIRVSCAGSENLAFVENHGSRYLSVYETETSTFTALTTASGLPIEKEIT